MLVLMEYNAALNCDVWRKVDPDAATVEIDTTPHALALKAGTMYLTYKVRLFLKVLSTGRKILMNLNEVDKGTVSL